MASQSCSLQLGTFNIWHGLDHMRPQVMMPMETRVLRRNRWAEFDRGLKQLLATPADLSVLSLQEVNPLDQRSALIQQSDDALQLRTMEVNVGLRVGRLSYPFFLQEGLCTAWKGLTSQIEMYRWPLSGRATQFTLPLGIPFTLQTSERRGALAVAFQCQSFRLLFVNVHLHHGALTEGADERRLSELKQLQLQIKALEPALDAVILVGDFNCESGQRDYGHLVQSGYQEISQTPAGAPLITWNPLTNPYCKASADHGGGTPWDQAPRQFDHIFIRPLRLQFELLEPSRIIFDGTDLPNCSDHYGLMSRLRLFK